MIFAIAQYDRFSRSIAMTDLTRNIVAIAAALSVSGIFFAAALV